MAKYTVKHHPKFGTVTIYRMLKLGYVIVRVPGLTKQVVKYADLS